MDFKEFKSKYASTFSEQQLAAVQAVEGRTLLLAVPGSGKTTVLVTRLGYMFLCCGISPKDVLIMTYTVAATRDMRERFASVFGEALANEVEFRTINGVSARIIGRFERMTGRKAFELETNEKHCAALISKICQGVRGEYLPEGEIKTIMSKIGYAKNMLLSDEEIHGIDREIKGFSRIFSEYKRILREQRKMDYDDQMVYAYNILKKFPEILAMYREEIRYVCVDEAQDTSKIQHMIIDLLSAGSGNLFMVGDEDQSIYGFRAAYPQALTEFSARYPEGKILLMERNYRSAGTIVTAADRFIQENKDRHPKHMVSNREEDGKIREIPLKSRGAQYTYLLKLAEDCREETAILYRDNSSVLPLLDLLERNGIGYRCRQGDLNFFTSRVVKDISDILRFAMNRSDKELFLQIYYKLNARITREAAQQAVKYCRNERSLLDWLSSNMGLSAWVRGQCSALETHMNNMLRENGGKAVYRILNYMGYGEYLEDRKMSDNDAQILRLIGNNEPSPRRLLERLEELQRIAAAGSTDLKSRMILSTIHSSKGLEYSRVILLDVTDKTFPSCDPSDAAAYEEERRLFYVGMTRAKNELDILTIEDRMYRSVFADTVLGKRAVQGDGRELLLRNDARKNGPVVVVQPAKKKKTKGWFK